MNLRPLLLAAALCLSGGSALAAPCGGAPDPQTTRPAARPQFRPERQADIRQRLAADAFGAITFGDSLMEGWGPRVLATAFGQIPLNSGFGQDGTENVLWRIQVNDWSRQKPAYVLLLVGTNDLKYPACSVVQGVLADVRAIQGALPGARVVVTSLLPRGENMAEHDAEIAEVNHDLAAAGRERGYLFFDVHDRFLCDHKTPCALYQPGNLHLTPQGYEVLTAELKQFLQARDPG